MKKEIDSTEIPDMSVKEFCEKLWGCKITESYNSTIISFPVVMKWNDSPVSEELVSKDSL